MQAAKLGRRRGERVEQRQVGVPSGLDQGRGLAGVTGVDECSRAARPGDAQRVGLHAQVVDREGSHRHVPDADLAAGIQPDEIEQVADGFRGVGSAGAPADGDGHADLFAEVDVGVLADDVELESLVDLGTIAPASAACPDLLGKPRRPVHRDGVGPRGVGRGCVGGAGVVLRVQPVLAQEQQPGDVLVTQARHDDRGEPVAQPESTQPGIRL
ncbi:hypothetical protein GCM10023321_50410 [Pseudonocardia eucalypti]|uniref:Uncharacterized protein n=1 Tax=Pseudonocardia eucalypti TaxID=648755 RepID=A0ABP9QL02_9PSEU